jgi:rubredoxin
MSGTFMTPDIPNIFWLRKTTYLCRKCNYVFDVLNPEGDDMVKFVEPDSNLERWMPMYGPRGYLEMFELLVPELKKGKGITVPLARLFDERFAQLQEPSPNGKFFSALYQERERCPKCGCLDIIIQKEVVLESPAVKWLRFQIHQP